MATVVGLLARRVKKSCIAMSTRPSSDMARFREELKRARDVVVVTGAGISAESGIPTFRGAGGLWRKYQAPDLATPRAFARDPALVWEFYHYRRELMRTKKPNPGHYALADFEKRYAGMGRTVTVITQNIDNLHFDAGSANVIELHGNLFKTRCTVCEDVRENRDSPICEGLRGKG
jgi:NAD-dependent deacetylase sirtuin 5